MKILFNEISNLDKEALNKKLNKIRIEKFSKKENMIIDFHEEQSKIDERLKNKIKEKIGEDFMEA